MKKYICQFKKINPTNNDQRTLQTVKIIRDVTSCGLKQAKNVVDGKLALMDTKQILQLIDSNCEQTAGTTGDGIALGFEYTVTGLYRDNFKDKYPTGYCFVVHREQ